MFEITNTAAKLKTLTPRIDKSGEDDVSAVSLGLQIVGPNTLLDLLQPGLREALYKAVEDQEQLPGVEESTPLLRTQGIESVRLTACFDGWTVCIDRGIDADDPIKLGASRVDKFVVAPSEGGSVDLSFRVGTNDIDQAEAGWLFGRLSHDLWITLRAPDKADAVLDRVVSVKRSELDATDLFIGGDPGPGSEATVDA